jgi:hypothetical protein
METPAEAVAAHSGFHVNFCPSAQGEGVAWMPIPTDFSVNYADFP